MRTAPAPGPSRAIALLAAMVMAIPGAAAAQLVPHAARYRMKLSKSVAAGDVLALRGSLEVRIEASCEGWHLEQALGFRMLAQGGQGLEHAAHLSGFEERDGGSFTFSSRTWEDREQVEEVSGVVRRDPVTGAVRVRYAMPEPETQELPRGVLFPGQHLEQLLTAARAGERGLMRVVFDGSTSENPYQISHWIGHGQVAGSGAPQALRGLRAWPVRLAYFELGALEPSPDFQMSVEIFDNGVAGNQTFDYGDFAVDVTVEAVELLPTPECG